MTNNLIVTGGAGFIGTNLLNFLVKNTDYNVIVIDKISYASQLNVWPEELQTNILEKGNLVRLDLAEIGQVKSAINAYNPVGILHLAAESHVDNSINDPSPFIYSNIVGTYNLLQASLDYYRTLEEKDKETFRFLHVSTDEVFGALGEDDKPFDEMTRYSPNSPYSSSKASSDHLVRAWHETFGLPVVITNCSNNYGPFQHHEKLIPTVIRKCFEMQDIPVYGTGENIRDWIHVEDHVSGIWHVFKNGNLGECYLLGSNKPLRNLEIIKEICSIVDELDPNEKKREDLITFVKDRAGHDWRYEINNSKAIDSGWKPSVDFESGLRDTIRWYLDKLQRPIGLEKKISPQPFDDKFGEMFETTAKNSLREAQERIFREAYETVSELNPHAKADRGKGFKITDPNTESNEFPNGEADVNNTDTE